MTPTTFFRGARVSLRDCQINGMEDVESGFNGCWYES